MSNFNPDKCYIEKSDDSQISSNCTCINYYFQLISSFLYVVIVLYFFFTLKKYFGNSVGGNGVRYFFLYFFGWPNLKIFLNSLFAPKLKLDFQNGVIYVNNKPFSIERAKNIDIVEIYPYHYSWRWGNTPAFNLSGYKKSVITISTEFGDIKFYVCSSKSLNLLIQFFDKFNKSYSSMLDERMLVFTFY